MRLQEAEYAPRRANQSSSFNGLRGLESLSGLPPGVAVVAVSRVAIAITNVEFD